MATPGTVLIGNQNHGIELGPETQSDSSYPYAGDSFTAQLFSEGLGAARAVFTFRHHWDTFARFFEDLATSWKGFEGEPVCLSIENDLEIRVTSDLLGHNRFAFVLQGGPWTTWFARVDSIELAAGENASALARSVAEWAQGHD